MMVARILRRNCQATSAPWFSDQGCDDTICWPRLLTHVLLSDSKGRGHVRAMLSNLLELPVPYVHVLGCQNPSQLMNNSMNKTVTFVSTQVLSTLHLYVCFQAPPILSHDYRFD
jgi:hypothetical protein